MSKFLSLFGKKEEKRITWLNEMVWLLLPHFHLILLDPILKTQPSFYHNSFFYIAQNTSILQGRNGKMKGIISNFGVKRKIFKIYD